MWTEPRVELLRAMDRQNVPRAEIAAALGVTRNAVIGKLDRLLGPAKPRPRLRTADASALLSFGC